jgi:hypothetical protein
MLKYNDRMTENLLDICHIQYEDIDRYNELNTKAIVYFNNWEEECICPMEKGYHTTEQTLLFDFLRDIICIKYNLITSMDGMLHNQIDEVDELINDCVEPLDFYGEEEIPASDAIFYLHKPRYTGYAHLFLISKINQIFDELLDKQICKISIKREIFGCYEYYDDKNFKEEILTFKLIDWDPEEE